MHKQKPHFLPGVQEWKQGEEFEVRLPSKVGAINDHFDDWRRTRSPLKLKFWIPVGVSKEIKRAVCRHPCLEVKGVVSERGGSLVVELKNAPKDKALLEEFLRENDVSVEKIYLRTFVESSFSLIFVVYKSRPSEHAAPIDGHGDSEEVDWGDAFKDTEVVDASFDRATNAGGGDAFKDAEVVDASSFDRATNAGGVTWELLPDQSIGEEKSNATCLEVKIGFRLRIRFQPDEEHSFEGTKRCVLRVTDIGVPFEFDASLDLLQDSRRFSLETKRCLKEYDGLDTQKCVDFYTALYGKVLKLKLKLPLTQEPVFVATFESQGAELWPYTPSAAKEVRDLVFEAFRDFVDIVSRTSYKRGNALLLACQDRNLTVEKITTVFREMKESFTKAHYRGDEVFGDRNRAAVAAVEPLIKSLQNAIDLYRMSQTDADRSRIEKKKRWGVSRLPPAQKGR
jgi:hypothetical protein